jgi:hypothetical protein
MSDGMVMIFYSRLTTSRPFFLRPNLSLTIASMSSLSSSIRVGKMKRVQPKTRLAKASSNFTSSRTT